MAWHQARATLVGGVAALLVAGVLVAPALAARDCNRGGFASNPDWTGTGGNDTKTSPAGKQNEWDSLAGNGNLDTKDESDHVCAGADDDTVYMGPDADGVDGGGGEDELYLEGNPAGYVEFAWGGAGGDVIDGGDGADQVFGEGGDDVIHGGNGGSDAYCECLDGDEGTDQVLGQGDDDFINGGPGDNDDVKGNLGDDTLYGGAGTGDSCIGGDGIDVIDVDSCEIYSYS